MFVKGGVGDARAKEVIVNDWKYGAVITKPLLHIFMHYLMGLKHCLQVLGTPLNWVGLTIGIGHHGPHPAELLEDLLDTVCHQIPCLLCGGLKHSEEFLVKQINPTGQL